MSHLTDTFVGYEGLPGRAPMRPLRGLRGWWFRKTVRLPAEFKTFSGEMLLRAETRFSLLDRMLILLGRTVVVEIHSSAGEPDLSDPKTYALIDGMRAFAWTVPRR